MPPWRSASRRSARSRPSRRSKRGPAPAVRLTDVSAASGLAVTHANGATGRKYLPETMGSGAAFVDVDGDGDQDLIVVSGVWTAGSAYARLFKNDGRGRFVEATAGSGLDIPPSRPSAASARQAAEPAGLDYGMGIAAGDYDNDGAADLLLTAVGHSRLFRNLGGGRFADVSAKAGLGSRRAFSTSAMWFDYDKDGRLDLLICNYVQWTPQSDIFCSADGKTKSYCTPEAYRGSTSWLYRNKGDGTFEDVTAKAGFFDVTSKSLGVTLLDYDQDGWPDVFVANDTQPNKLYRNNRNGTFTELGLKAGVAFSEEGRARAGMGVDAADLDGSGRPTVAVTNFSGEMLGLYRADVDGQYVDRAPGSDIGRATRQTLGWGCFFFDVEPGRPAGSARRQRPPRRGPRGHRRTGRCRRRHAAPVPQRAAAASPTSRARPARRSPRRRWAAAPPSPTSTATAISTP